MNNNFTLRLRLKDADIAKITDSAKGAKPKTIKVRMSATHSGLVNKNFWFYTPKGMADGADSFVKPYSKPVTLNHDPYSDPVGRVTESTYISYGIDKYFDTATPETDKNYMKKVKDLMKSKSYQDVGFKGLGEISLIAEITDETAIEKLLDRRYLTVSVGGGSDAAYCSICGNDKMKKDCGHYRGDSYNDQTCFLVSSKLNYRHVSYVSEPADENAISEVMDHNDNTTIEILDFTLGTKSTDMKLTLQELKDKFGTYQQFVEKMKEFGVGDQANAELNAKAAATKFVFADEKLLPIYDKAHYLISHKLITELLEDSEVRTQILEVLDAHAKDFVDEGKTIEDAFNALIGKTQDNTQTNTTNTQTIAQISDETIDIIVNKVLDGLKQTFSISDSYASKRLSALEKDNSALEKQVSGLENKYKDNVVLQILSFEDKIEDQDYKALLVGRSIVSLEDKLSDLVASKGTVSAKQTKDLQVATVADAAGTVVEDNTAQNGEVQTQTDQEPTPLSNKEIHDEYKNLARTKGLKAASQYLDGLRAEKKLPKNFTFNT